MSVLHEATWQTFLRSRFPAYLLPEAALREMSRAEATRFLQVVTGRADALELLRAASLFARYSQELRAFVERDLIDVVRALPSRSVSTRRTWRGGYHGRLHMKDTLSLRIQGDVVSFVTLSQERVFDLPENVVLRAVSTRVLALLSTLRDSGVLRKGVGWGSELWNCEAILRTLLASSKLRNVSDRPVQPSDENAARSARHVAYHRAVAWLRRIESDIDSNDGAKIADVVSRGALLPLGASRQFELAVLIRLAETLEREVMAREPGRWRVERGIIYAGRRDVYALLRSDGLSIRIHYNQSTLPEGRVDKGRRYYLQTRGRLRPDVTLVFERREERFNAVVVECKQSEDPAVLTNGYHEAYVYLVEYEEHLRAQPKAILVASAQIPVAADPNHDVVAEGWEGWPSPALAERLVAMALC